MGFSNNKLLKIILLGDGGVGKSSLIQRFVNHSFDPRCSHTIGVEFLVKEMTIDNHRFTVQIWDTAGQERYRSLRTPFYRGCDICILTFGLDSLQSFDNLDHWFAEFYNYGDLTHDQPFPFIVLGNKCDIPEDQQLISEEKVKEWCKAKASKMIENLPPDINAKKFLDNNGIPYVITSAQSAQNVDEGFQFALKLWSQLDVDNKNSLVNLAEFNDSTRVQLNQSSNRSFRSCC